MSSNQFQITSIPRHLRYVFFVAENYPYESLLSLMHQNQNVWGGRFNPIVPVRDGEISEEWKNVLRFYDPDYVVYSKEIKPDIIKRLRMFNPLSYINLDEGGGFMYGVSSFYLLSQFHFKTPIILTSEIWKTESPLLSYFKTNFGFERDLVHPQYELTKDFARRVVKSDEFQILNKLISELKPINQSHLSRKNPNTVLLRSNIYSSYYPFEMVIAKDKSSNTDLFYFWNRMLFELRQIIYVTVEELELLCKDEYFGRVLHDIDYDHRILVTSQSLNKEEVQEIIDNKLRKTTRYTHFDYGKVENFPFDLLDSHGTFIRNSDEKSTIQTFGISTGLYHLPGLSFTNTVTIGSVVDIQIEKFNKSYQSNLKFPLTTDTHHIFKHVKGRINKLRNISLFINDDRSNGIVEYDIPEFKEMISQLICNPVIDGVQTQAKSVEIGLSDASNKLITFIKLFNNDLSTIDDFFSDKFWVDVIEQLAKSRKATGNAITFEEIINKCRPQLLEKGIIKLNSDRKLEGKKGETYLNDENLELGLKSTIGELCDYKVLLKGFSLKCPKCSSQYWYHIDEIHELIKCNGCLEQFKLPIEPKFAYKINDLIRNNMFQFDGTRDGNLTVIRTLASLSRGSGRAFDFSPQINLFNSHHTNDPCGDIDIVCIADGKFIIGESKHESSAFKENSWKSLKTLIEVSKEIKPDKIILSCYHDSHNKLNNAKAKLIRDFGDWEYSPKIETLLLYEPSDFHLGDHRYFYY